MKKLIFILFGLLASIPAFAQNTPFQVYCELELVDSMLTPVYAPMGSEMFWTNESSIQSIVAEFEKDSLSKIFSANIENKNDNFVVTIKQEKTALLSAVIPHNHAEFALIVEPNRSILPKKAAHRFSYVKLQCSYKAGKAN